MLIIKCAVNTVGNDILFIKDNEVIGKGKCVIAYGSDWVGVNYLEGELLETLLQNEFIRALTLKYIYFHFRPLTGSFIDDREIFDCELGNLFEDVRVVDEFNFNWGMVPDTFKDVPGYRSSVLACKKD